MARHYRTVTVDGIKIFYREAGPQNAPVLLLLHGFPSSSRMYEPLLDRLSDKYHLIAPDYPGFGLSECPSTASFVYTFDHLAEMMDDFVTALGLDRFALYMQDYGGPVGFRLAMKKPSRISALIIQNAVVHEVGLGPLWEMRKAFWKDRALNEAALRQNFFSLEATRSRHVGSDPDATLYDPNLWMDELAFLQRDGIADIQTELFFDYQTNIAMYPHWSEWLRNARLPLLVLWGKFDPSFTIREPAALQTDVATAEVHVLDAGHFALDTRPDQIAHTIRDFLPRTSR
jgi:pimeloyl-ACP methyl ester carboxylesterase